MKALLRSKGLWRLVDAKETRPADNTDGAQDKWDAKADKAAGEIMLNIEADQRVHIRSTQDNPVAAWKALASIYLQRKPGARFAAYDEFFGIRKREDESLSALTARVDQAMLKIKELRPSDATNPFTIDNLDDELVCMTLVRSLPQEYSHFTSSLLLLSSMDKETLKSAFIAEDMNRQPRADAATPSGDSALATTSPRSCGCPTTSPCDFCDKPGHCEHMCYARQRAKDSHKASRRKGKGKNANKAEETSSNTPAATNTPSAPPINSASANAGSMGHTESAGNASLRSSDPSDPLCPLQLDADIDWNADTRATAHMTPHRHWLRNYTPKRVPIKLADHTIVYSAEVGSVVFQPVIEGRSMRAVELTRVLHVPDLRNNLLSVLYLTRHSGFVVNINSSTMVFSRPPGPTLFVATINDSNAAFLDGTTLPITQYARPASTLPLDLSLWHRRLAHHHLEGVKTLYKRDMVTGMKLDLRTPPHPVCEPCLAGKVHANPFPSSEWHASRPLELMHTDVHMLVKINHKRALLCLVSETEEKRLWA